MAIELTRKSGIPLYIQLKDQIRHQIEANAWQPGFKLPTERELAAILGVSRNTVSMAYRELETEGELVSAQGKGTFVSEQATDNLNEVRRLRLQQIMGDAFDQAIALGYGFDEILEAANEQAEERKALRNMVRIAFIECNREQVDYFAHQLELSSGVVITPLVLGEIRHDSERLRQVVSEVDLVVTTFFHYDEVCAMVKEEKPVLAIALDAQLETIVKIARVPRGKRLGLVCLSTNFADKVVNSIRSAGIDYLPVETTISLDQSDVSAVIARSDVMLVSPGRRREVEELCPDNKEIIEFVYRPDLGSIGMLKAALMKIEEQYNIGGETSGEHK